MEASSRGFRSLLRRSRSAALLPAEAGPTSTICTPTPCAAGDARLQNRDTLAVAVSDVHYDQGLPRKPLDSATPTSLFVPRRGEDGGTSLGRIMMHARLLAF